MKKNMEKGQSLILVTLLLFAFFAILALVLDGGFLYYLRRNAQNAADAGALAGADDLCKFKIPSQAEAVAEAYAFDNGVSSAVASATLMNPGGIVEVNTSIDYQTFFARLLNIDSVSPPAFARAGCAPLLAGGVMPVAWSCKAPVGESPQPEMCEVLFMDSWTDPDDDDGECIFGEDPMYIIADSDTIEDDIVCDDPDIDPPIAGTVNCDLDGDGENDIELLGGGDRSWLDLNAGGGGAAELKDWVKGDYEGLFVRPHNWVPVQAGEIGSVYLTVHETILGVDVVVPIFDSVHPDGPPPVDWPFLHPEDVIVGNEPHDYFHLITFSYWRTTCVDAGPYPQNPDPPCPARTALNGILDTFGWSNGDINSLASMEGCFLEGNVNGIGGEPGQGVDAGVYTIFLME